MDKSEALAALKGARSLRRLRYSGDVCVVGA